MPDTRQQKLKKSFNTIIQEYPKGIAVNLSEIKKLNTVKDSIDLVLQRANEEVVSREEIKPQVIDEIKEILDFLGENIPDEIKETFQLDNDLNITNPGKLRLISGFNDIIENYQGNLINPFEAGGIKTVKQSIDLVYKRANRK